MFSEDRGVSNTHFSPNKLLGRGHRGVVYKGKEQYTRRELGNLKDTLPSQGT